MQSISQNLSAETDDDPEVAVKSSSVPVPFSESVPLHCKVNDRDYNLYIRYPDGYQEKKNKDRHYPVVYICDAQWDFFLISGIYPTLIFDGTMKESILVGMAWGGKTDNYWLYRGIDYTPVPSDEGNPDGGKAELTLRALKTEIIPFVEGHVRADRQERIITGSSYGGVFVLYTLIQEPDLFSGYIAPTPAVLYADNCLLPVLEKKLNENPAPVFSGRVYMTAGEKEADWWQQSIVDFEKRLNGLDAPNLTVKTEIVQGENHSGQKAEAYNRGLRFVFEE